jgi:nitrate reductase beta subunit
MTSVMADAIYSMTAHARFNDRFIIPAAHREEAIEMIQQTNVRKENTGFGFIEKPERGL